MFSKNSLQAKSRERISLLLRKADTDLSSKNSISHYIIGQRIGSGGYATVYRGLERYTNTQVAIKVVEFNYLTPYKKSRLESQINILKLVDHPNILKIYEAIWCQTKVFIITQLIHGRELFQQIFDKGPLSQPQAVKVISKIISAVQYLHQKGICHRDIKAENIMIDKNQKPILIDFGLAKKITYDTKSLYTTVCGSRSYLAPEMVEGKIYSGKEVDIWALGVILYVTIEGLLPFDHGIDTLQNIKRIKWRKPKRSSQEALDFFTKIFQERKERISLEELFSHPLFIKHGIKLQFKNLFDSPKSEERNRSINQVSQLLGLSKMMVQQNLRNGDIGVSSCLYRIILGKKKIKFKRVETQGRESKSKLTIKAERKTNSLQHIFNHLEKEKLFNFNYIRSGSEKKKIETIESKKKNNSNLNPLKESKIMKKAVNLLKNEEQNSAAWQKILQKFKKWEKK